MPEDYGTMNLKRHQALGREIEVLRRRYADHDQALARLEAEAPTEHLARRYGELREEIRAAVE
ncbi:MAG: hypothetical protein WBX15_18275, partial [Thermoanaerobaculia bacterium]